MSAPGFVLGLDGGGSKTRVALAAPGRDSPRPMSEVTGPGGDLPSLGEEGMARHLAELRRRVLDAAGASSTEVSVAVLGLPGYGTHRAWSDALARAARNAFPRARRILLNDVALAREAAFASGPGILALAGTGAMAWGSNSQGTVRTAGGWGFLFGDEGGGYDLAREGLRAASHAVDGRGPDTTLAASLPAALHAHTMGEAVHRLARDLTRVRAETAALAPVVLHAARGDDPVARDLVVSAATSLIAQVRAVRRGLGDEELPLVGMGGMFRASPYAEAFDRGVREAGLGPRRPAAETPVEAALRLGHDDAR